MADRKILFWGICLVATLAAAPFFFAHFTGGFSAYAQALSRISAAHWAVILMSTVAFYLLDYLRFYSLLAIFDFKLPITVALKLTCVSYFVSSLTPSAELHLPAMVFLLVREGVAVGTATAVTITKSIYMTLWICAIALVSLELRGDVHVPEHLARHLPLYLLPMASLVAFLGLVVLFPRQIHAWAERRLTFVVKPVWQGKIIQGVDHAAQALSKIASSTHYMHLVCHAGSIAFVLMYGWIGYVICHGLGLAVPLGKAITVFSNGLMVAYLSPVPGSVGITEVMTNYLLDPALTNLGMAAVLTQRILCWYIVIVPGSLLLVSSLRGMSLRKALLGEKS
ncbi:MAG: flippase-like domain-containing protein [Deltaproteobacteria bacterium]|nr:flippase-like domain-containing protein [Deltaproteobacteria bacterium]